MFVLYVVSWIVVDGTSPASLSTLQSCVSNSIQAGRSQGPEISTKLSKYFRGDLITHVTNWAADQLEKQVSFQTYLTIESCGKLLRSLLI